MKKKVSFSSLLNWAKGLVRVSGGCPWPHTKFDHFGLREIQRSSKANPMQTRTVSQWRTLGQSFRAGQPCSL